MDKRKKITTPGGSIQHAGALINKMLWSTASTPLLLGATVIVRLLRGNTATILMMPRKHFTTTKLCQYLRSFDET